MRLLKKGSKLAKDKISNLDWVLNQHQVSGPGSGSGFDQWSLVGIGSRIELEFGVQGWASVPGRGWGLGSRFARISGPGTGQCHGLRSSFGCHRGRVRVSDLRLGLNFDLGSPVRVVSGVLGQVSDQVGSNLESKDGLVSRVEVESQNLNPELGLSLRF
ncbi:hypothetical protein HAX54_052513 [Datura stramonium]|uniref:Uncharacterized protein n=1 Tax=Datura stramonium TaxID=4076 RepID=A0ABS8SZU2_DATST|nr:hypothetical protein [Datura stramonium]